MLGLKVRAPILSFGAQGLCILLCTCPLHYLCLLGEGSGAGAACPGLGGEEIS